MAQETHVQRPVLAALPRLTGLASRVFGWALIALVAVWLVGNFINAPAEFMSVFLTGTRDGAIYVLVAIGYTLVYGIIELINFAHGDVFMWGTMVTVTVAGTWFGLDGSQAWFVTIPLVFVTLAAAMTF